MSIDYDAIYKKIMAHLQSVAPKAPKKILDKLARGRTNTWCSFMEKEDSDMPLLSLFKEVGELSDVKIRGVKVDYPTEPSIVLEAIFKGTKRYSYMTYDEALSELETAVDNNVDGARKLQDVMERLEMEMIDTRKVRKVGNSLIVTIPESVSSLFDLENGDYLSFIYRFGSVKIKKASPELSE